jgi:hypothetical protein
VKNTISSPTSVERRSGQISSSQHRRTFFLHLEEQCHESTKRFLRPFAQGEVISHMATHVENAQSNFIFRRIESDGCSSATPRLALDCFHALAHLTGIHISRERMSCRSSSLNCCPCSWIMISFLQYTLEIQEREHKFDGTRSRVISSLHDLRTQQSMS